MTLAESYQKHLSRVIAYCSAYEGPGLTPSDLAFDEISIDELEKFLEQ
jgi:hypothetical protein